MQLDVVEQLLPFRLDPYTHAGFARIVHRWKPVVQSPYDAPRASGAPHPSTMLRSYPAPSPRRRGREPGRDSGWSTSPTVTLWGDRLPALTALPSPSNRGPGGIMPGERPNSRSFTRPGASPLRANLPKRAAPRPTGASQAGLAIPVSDNTHFGHGSSNPLSPGRCPRGRSQVRRPREQEPIGMGEHAHPRGHGDRMARESRQAASSRGWGSRRDRRPATEGCGRLSLMLLLDTNACMPLSNRTDAGEGIRSQDGGLVTGSPRLTLNQAAGDAGSNLCAASKRRSFQATRSSQCSGMPLRP